MNKEMNHKEMNHDREMDHDKPRKEQRCLMLEPACVILYRFSSGLLCDSHRLFQL